MNLKNIMKNLLIHNILIVFIFCFFSILKADAQDFQNNTINTKINPFSFGFSGFIQYGDSRGTAIAPENTSPDNIGTPYETGYGFGGHLLYQLNNEWKIFLECGYSERRILCARKGEYGVGSWISDMTGDTLNNFYGPFDSDVYFYMGAFIIRPGLKYYLQNDENIKPWFGFGISVYPWNASYMGGDRSKIWATASGVCLDFTFLYFGIDMNIDLGEKERVVFSLFADLGAPSVKLRFDNLFENGWTYINDIGEEVIAPYKFGIIMLFEL